ncbi:hypothetical protein LPJ66_002539, partial [Kickxella alabastrina]
MCRQLDWKGRQMLGFTMMVELSDTKFIPTMLLRGTIAVAQVNNDHTYVICGRYTGLAIVKRTQLDCTQSVLTQTSATPPTIQMGGAAYTSAPASMNMTVNKGKNPAVPSKASAPLALSAQQHEA